MSSTNNEKLEVTKDQTNFLHQCKDLFKYIKRKIIKVYVCPEFPNPEVTIPNPWSYINKQETLTEKDKCCDMFKDDTFLPLVQKCYEALENVIKRMDENRKNVEFMKKNIEVGEKKIKLLSELNNQLNSYFNKGEGNNNNDGIGKNNIADQLNLAKTLTILNDLQNMNAIKTTNFPEAKENSNKDNIINKCDNNLENTDLTSDYLDETKTYEEIKLIGKKRDLNFNEILDADVKSKKKIKLDNIPFSEKLTQKTNFS